MARLARGCRFGRLGAVLLGAAALAWAAPGSGQEADPSAAVLAPLGDAFEKARAAFEALPEAERAALQDALVWTGDYAAAADGTFGRRSFEAIQAHQRRARQQPTGLLDRGARAALLAAGAREREEAGFAVAPDPPTGLVIGIPHRLLPRRSQSPNGGSRFQSADGHITLDTRAGPGGEEELKAAYERNLAIATPGRRVTYRLARPDFFVLSGETAGGRFYLRSATRDDVIRGLSIGYDRALASEVERVVVAISNSFVPFPGPAALRAPPVAGARPTAAPRAEPAAFTGLAIGPRRIVTAAAVGDACREPLVEGARARVLSVDKALGLALLEPGTARRATAPLLSSGPAEGTGMAVFAAAGEGGRTLATAAELEADRHVVAPLQEGAAGAVLLDRAGALVGIVAAPAAGTRKVAGLVPPARHPYVPAADLARFIGDDAPAGSRPTAGGLAAVAANVVRVGCPAGPQ